MKKIKWSIVLFLVLAILLSEIVLQIGLHYVINSENSTKQEEVQKMTIALVNEDQGTNFEGQQLGFGNQFVKSIEKDNSHEWYIVSRGVAESGLKRGIYNLMIVIPSDFSEKSISITSTSPEKVTLSYKVNSTGNADLETEAEKAAASILEDINRQIIDVYFASILTNLQQAQDNIETLVATEDIYTNKYNTDIISPLSGYTQQFQTVQDYTAISKDGFQGFQELLQGYQGILQESGTGNEEYMTLLDSYMAQQETNSPFGLMVNESLQNFGSSLGDTTVQEQLASLQQANSLFSLEFQSNSEVDNLLGQTENIQQYVTDVNSRMAGVSNDISTILDSNLQLTVASRLKEILQEGSELGQKQYFLNELSEDINKKFQDGIVRTIKELPTFEAELLGDLGLPYDKYNNVINISKKYVSSNLKDFQDFDFSGTGLPIENLKNEIVDSLKNEGVNLESKEVVLQKSEYLTNFTLSIMEGFEFDYISIVDVGADTQEKIAITFDSADSEESNQISFYIDQLEEKTTIKIYAHAKLKEEQESVPLFGSIDWSGMVQQQELLNDEENNEDSSENTDNAGNNEDNNEDSGNVEEEDSSENTDNAGNNEDNNEDSGNVEEEDSSENTGNEENNENTDENAGNEENNENTSENDGNEESDENTSENAGNEENNENTDENAGNEEGNEDNGENTGNEDNNENNGEDTGDVEEGDSEEPTPNETVTFSEAKLIDVNRPLILKDSSKAGEAIYKTVKSYERLAELYSLYYGLNVANTDGIPSDNGWSFEDVAKPTSYYSIFNQQDVLDKIISLSSDKVTQAYATKLKEFQQQIEAYQENIADVENRSKDVTTRLVDVHQETESLNDNLGNMLDEIEAWRETSIELIDQSEFVIQNNEDEQMVVMQLNSDFSSLFLSSQGLADTTDSNLESANTVYETFEAIDNEAKSIQESGMEIVEESEKLSQDLIAKLNDDQTFSTNFSDVLSNSRIGERQNESLYEFLSRPVDKENTGTVESGNTTTPYYFVLIFSIVALFTGYVISSQEKKRYQKDQFAEEMSLPIKNAPITYLMVSVALVEGIIIGYASGSLFVADKTGLLLWMGVCMLIMLALVSFCTYFLRQLQMFGMFIILIILSLYLFLTDAVGLRTDSEFIFARFKVYSPLQYIEQLLSNILHAQTGSSVLVYGFIAATVALIILNIFVWRRENPVEEAEEYEE